MSLEVSSAAWTLPVPLQQKLDMLPACPCREQDWVKKGEFGLDEDLYKLNTSGLIQYLGDLCRRDRHQWADYMMLVSSLLWPALHYKAGGFVVLQVSTWNACGI